MNIHSKCVTCEELFIGQADECGPCTMERILRFYRTAIGKLLIHRNARNIRVNVSRRRSIGNTEPHDGYVYSFRVPLRSFDEQNLVWDAYNATMKGPSGPAFDNKSKTGSRCDWRIGSSHIHNLLCLKIVETWKQEA